MQLPKRVTLELTNRCNRKCLGCPRHKMIYPLGDMNASLYNRVLDQLPKSTVIVPFFRGEATMHPHFAEFAQRLSNYKDVQFATNADYFTHENKRAILETVTFLSLSLHKFKLPIETDWLPFLHEAEEAGVETQISIVENELPWKWHGLFTREWLKHASRVRIYEEHSQNGFGSIRKETCAEPCNKPFEEMVVYWDGKVGLCNHDWNNQVWLGDLNVQSIEEVWQGLPYENVRKQHSQGLRSVVPSCEFCSFESNKVYGEVNKNGR